MPLNFSIITEVSLEKYGFGLDTYFFKRQPFSCEVSLTRQVILLCKKVIIFVQEHF